MNCFFTFLLPKTVYTENSRFNPQLYNYFHRVTIALFIAYENRIQGRQQESIETFRHTYFKVVVIHLNFWFFAYCVRLGLLF